MTADELIRANETPPAPTKVRIAHKWGEGDFHHISEVRLLKMSVLGLNAEYGPGTHWLEYEA